MAKSKATPGPWVMMTAPEYDGERLGDGSVVGGYVGHDAYDRKFGVCAQSDLDEATEQGVDPYPICTPELEADARLIAAAPDLLAVCEAAIEQHRAHHVARGEDEDAAFAPGAREIYQAMKAAVARAKGGAP